MTMNPDEHARRAARWQSAMDAVTRWENHLAGSDDLTMALLRYVDDVLDGHTIDDDGRCCYCRKLFPCNNVLDLTMLFEEFPAPKQPS